MAEPKKVVYGVAIHDNKCKRKAMKAISSLEGIHSIEMNMKDKKMTVVGVINPACGYKKLSKVCYTEILIVEPVKKETPIKPPPVTKPQPPITPVPCYGSSSLGNYVIMEENPNCCVIS